MALCVVHRSMIERMWYTFNFEIPKSIEVEKEILGISWEKSLIHVHASSKKFSFENFECMN